MNYFTLAIPYLCLTACGGLTDYVGNGANTTCDTGDCGSTSTECLTPDCDHDGHDSLTDGGDDCDDYNDAVYPGATEVCDGVDNNCNDAFDDADPTLDTSTYLTWYFDDDSDGYGNDLVTQLACDAGVGWAIYSGDCDDTNNTINPGAGETNCDGIDNDCQEATPDAPDSDGDGYGVCDEGSADYDCDDSDASINPGAFEVCGDGIDANCNGEDCDDWLEDFESGSSLDPVWSTSGNANWMVVGNAAYEGSYGAKSGSISSYQSTALSVSITWSEAGSISFWHKESSESGYDYLSFSIDGSQQGSWSGTTNWTSATYSVAAGTHTLNWTYSKDGSLNGGSDTVYIDYIEAIGGTP